MKGAPEKITAVCTTILLPDGHMVELSKDALNSIEAAVSSIIIHYYILFVSGFILMYFM